MYVAVLIAILVTTPQSRYKESWDSDAAVMHAAQLLLARNMAALVTEAKSDDTRTKRNAVWALGLSGQPRFVPIIVEASISEETADSGKLALHNFGLHGYRLLQSIALHGFLHGSGL